MRFSGRSAIAIVWASMLAVGACSETMQPEHGPDTIANLIRNALVISGPLSARSGIVAAGSAPPNLLVFASMPPGTLSSGDSVEIAPVGASGALVVAPMFEGGFDPVGIDAEGAESLAIAIFANGARHPVTVRIPSNRAPAIVRTSPARGRTDVALNQQIKIVFSQPIDGSTITATSIELLSSGTLVPVSVALEAGRPWIVDVVPTSPLLPNTVYNIVVDGSIRDTDGSLLSAPLSSDFETGTSESGTSSNPSVCDGVVSSTLPASSYTLTSVDAFVPPFLMPQALSDSVFIRGGTLSFTGGSQYEISMREHGLWGNYHFGSYRYPGRYTLCGGVLSFYGESSEDLLFVGSATGAQVRVMIPDFQVWQEDDKVRVWTYTLTP